MCFERIGVASWRPRQRILWMTREELAANRSVLASRSGVNRDFAGEEKDGWGKEGSARHTGREPCWHGERKTNQRPTSAFHELFHIGAGRATGRRMAMRTI